MKDREFLAWIHERLTRIHGEGPLFGYMHKLRCIIVATPDDRETLNTGEGGNHLEDAYPYPPSGQTHDETKAARAELHAAVSGEADKPVSDEKAKAVADIEREKAFGAQRLQTKGGLACMTPSLRDFFAAGATDRDIEATGRLAQDAAEPTFPTRVEARYMHADEMLAAREKGADEVRVDPESIGLASSQVHAPMPEVQPPKPIVRGPLERSGVEATDRERKTAVNEALASCNAPIWAINYLSRFQLVVHAAMLADEVLRLREDRMQSQAKGPSQ